MNTLIDLRIQYASAHSQWMNALWTGNMTLAEELQNKAEVIRQVILRTPKGKA